MDNYLTVSLDGKDVNIYVIDIVENNENNKKYMIYSIDNSDDVLMSILEEDETSFTLKTIDDEEEAKQIEEYYESLIETGEL